MDESLRRELEDLIDEPLWGAERFPDRNLSETEKWQIAHWAIDKYNQQRKQEIRDMTLFVLQWVVVIAAVMFISIVAFMMLHQFFIKAS